MKFIGEDMNSKVKGSSFVEKKMINSHWLVHSGHGGSDRSTSPARASTTAARAKFPWSNIRFVS
ncbi:unnamed protein product [Brassica napus]|uniref:(rape) hypothetical protein n=1 Tax=Brassica napus TaxID=3708 RepID=A0A816T563_BRANA|nr:unnamed protein product [Brassica napus]